LPEKRATLFGAMKRSRLERLDAALDSLDGSYLRPSDIARKLAIRRTQANKLIKDGTLPHVRIGRAVRVPAPAFAAYLRSLYDAEAGRGMPRGGSADGLG
jgi:excisionase family DNA binding protein